MMLQAADWRGFPTPESCRRGGGFFNFFLLQVMGPKCSTGPIRSINGPERCACCWGRGRLVQPSNFHSGHIRLPYRLLFSSANLPPSPSLFSILFPLKVIQLQSRMQQILLSNPWWPLLQSHGGVKAFFLGRRQLFIDSMSSVCSDSHQLPGNDVVLLPRPSPPQVQRKMLELERHPEDLADVKGNKFLFATRRFLLWSLFTYSVYHPSRYLSAHALGDSTVTLEEVTPQVFPSESLFPAEERIAELFEKNTYSVVNIFDITLRPQLNITGAVEVPEGNGSGVVWDEQGHVVTNYHVIGSALARNARPGETVARVNILASEGIQKNFEGRLVGADRSKDLAVLKVEASEDLLKPIKVGQSTSLKVGQQCLAIGNPFGFDHTLTVGVISGLNREIFSQTGVTIGGGIQTDAAINPGNSGGPLLDSKGKLIGINTAIFTRTGTSAGVGFAIPSSTVAKIVPQLIQYSKVVRAGLNLEFASDLTANQLNVRNGALVLQVPGNSLAAKAGIIPTTRGFAGNIVLGDIIVAVDGKRVKNKAELDRVLDDYNVGDTVTLKIQRGSETLELPIKLEEKSS